jgi:cell wall assembly regulator SMI1
VLNEVRSAQRDLLAFGVKDVSLQTSPPVTLAELQAAEMRIGYRLPDTLRRVFLTEAGSLKFQWDTDLFGSECEGGYAWLRSPEEIAETFQDQVGMAEEAHRDGLDVGSDGYEALVKDWPHWIPVFRFPAGDCFCLDVSEASTDAPIVFGEHDVMDSGPNLHGLRIAENFADLVDRWNAILFLDAYDWTRVVGTDGIDKDSQILQPLRKVPRALSTGRSGGCAP